MQGDIGTPLLQKPINQFSKSVNIFNFNADLISYNKDYLNNIIRVNVGIFLTR